MDEDCGVEVAAVIDFTVAGLGAGAVGEVWLLKRIAPNGPRHHLLRLG